MYKLINTYMGNVLVGQTIVRDNNNGSITSFNANPDNTDYQAYLKWVAEGNEPLPAENE